MREIASGESSQKNRSGEQEKKKPRDGGYSSEQLDDDTKKQNLGLEFGRDYKNLSAAITQLQKQVKDLEGRINSKQEEIKNKESEMKKINAFFDEMPIRQKRGGTYRKFRQEKKKYQEEIAELKKSKETLLTAAIQRLEEKNKNKDSSKKCDDIQTEINSLDNKINKQRKALNKDGSELAKINAQRQDLEKQLFELSQKSQVPQDLLKKDLTSLTEESTELQTELQNLRTKMTDVEKNKRVLEQQRNSDTNRLKNINMLRENKSSDIGLLKTALSQIDNLEKKNLKREQRAKRLDESLDKLQRDQEICQKIIEGQEKG